MKEKAEEMLKEMVPKYFREDSELQVILEEKKEKAKEILMESYNEVDAGNIIRKIESTLYLDKGKNERGDIIDMGGKVYFFPTIQMPCLDYRVDENFYEKFLEYNT